MIIHHLPSLKKKNHARVLVLRYQES